MGIVFPVIPPLVITPLVIAPVVVVPVVVVPVVIAPIVIVPIVIVPLAIMSQISLFLLIFPWQSTELSLSVHSIQYLQDYASPASTHGINPSTLCDIPYHPYQFWEQATE